MVPSYRGVTHGIIERSPPGYAASAASSMADGLSSMAASTSTTQGVLLNSLAATAAASPLPTRWNELDKFPGIEVLAGGFEVRFSGASKSGSSHDEAAAVRANHAMPRQCGIYYFEVTVMSKGKDG